MKFSNLLTLGFSFSFASFSDAQDNYFQRVANFPICKQIDDNCDTDIETSAEIIVASEDGMTLLYTDSPNEQVGFIDITDPSDPSALGTLAMDGEPTSITVCGDYAIAAVNTAEDFVNVSGKYVVIDVASQSIVTTGPLPGQPDAIDWNKDCTIAVVAIENERDEDLNDGELPQFPAGSVYILNTSEVNPANWSGTDFNITGLDGVAYASDPEPEYVSINSENQAVVTLQENNAIVIIDLAEMKVWASFSAGTVDLIDIDTEEEGALIQQDSSLDGVPREPDGVTWIDDRFFVTADEGDLDGGSRGFTIFKRNGKIKYTSGNDLDLQAIRLGHYPDSRSGNKGNEPENVDFGVFDGDELIFVNSERSGLVFVYDVDEKRKKPKLLQILPAGVGPEGVYAIPDRDLVVVASEVDGREDKIRSVVNIYQRGFDEVSYPTLTSKKGEDGFPIPFGALSGLAAPRCGDNVRSPNKCSTKPCNKRVLYTIEDNYYLQNRILEIYINRDIPQIKFEHYILDANDVFKNALAGTDFEEFTGDLINDDGTVNIDSEGIATSEDYGFWLVSEGTGTFDDPDRPIESPNLLFRLDDDAVIESVIFLPDSLNAVQFRFGFEGVAEYGDKVVCIFQRAWNGEANPRIGLYDTTTDTWSFLYYPLDEPESQYGGWVGLADIAPVGEGLFYVVERDNHGGPDAAVKRIYSIDLSTASEGETVEKTLVKDLYDDLAKATNGPIVEKVEGLTVTPRGEIWIVNDNDGVDDNSGETLLMEIDIC